MELDTVTHALFGLVLYHAIERKDLSKDAARSLLFVSVAGSEIPDIDVVSQLWDRGGEYLMWHRGITHSLFLVPLWAALLTAMAHLIWRVYDKRLFAVGLLAVFIHITIDIFNPWGTGYWEPFSQKRLALGTIPIIDLVMWGIILGGFLAARFGSWPRHTVFRTVACLLLLQVASQTAQGLVIQKSLAGRYDQVTLAADFFPGSYKVIGKKGNDVEITQASLWSEPILLKRLTSAEGTDLTPLFTQNPEAQTLYRWAPMVVIVNNEQRLGIYDPRFFHRGESFLYEYIEK
jgi:inner membrane protein